MMNGSNNADKVTLADVAEHAGVSTMTVSRVVNDHAGVNAQMRERVKRAIEELGYRPNIVARGLKDQRSRAVGLLVPDITNPYFPEIVRGAEDVAFERGYTVFLNNAIEDMEREAKALQAFEDRRVDGVISFSPRLPDDRLFALLRRHGAAVVVNKVAPTDVAGSVRVDHRRGMQLAVEHLVGVGRTSLAVLLGPPTSYSAAERRIGIESAATAAGLSIPEERFQYTSPHIDGGDLSASELLSRGQAFDGLLCFNDLAAVGAIRALERHGLRVPGDVAVVGCDDIPFARMISPPLTTLRVDMPSMGVQAMRMLFDRMDGIHRTIHVLVQPELVVRASTAGEPVGAAA